MMSEIDINQLRYSISDVAKHSAETQIWAARKEQERFKARLQNEIDWYETHGFSNNEDKIVIPVLKSLIKWLEE